MKQIMQMLINYIESIDDENFLTTIMLEKDFSGRDALTIAVELELLDLIQTPKVEAIIKRIYNSDYNLDGNLFEMSTSYQMVFSKNSLIRDIESKYRFYHARDLSHQPQSSWQLEVIKQSMESKILAKGVVGTIYVIACGIVYQIVNNNYLNLQPGIGKILRWNL